MPVVHKQRLGADAMEAYHIRNVNNASNTLAYESTLGHAIIISLQHTSPITSHATSQKHL